MSVARDRNGAGPTAADSRGVLAAGRLLRTAVSASLLLTLLSSCSGEPAASPRSETTPSSSRAPAPGGCPELPPLAAIPERFPRFPLPPTAVSVEPAARPRKGIRVDLFVSDGVTPTQRFFLRAIRERKLDIVFNDNEGFEAEVFFSFRDGSSGLIRILTTCHDGSMVSFEVIPRSSG